MLESHSPSDISLPFDRKFARNLLNSQMDRIRQIDGDIEHLQCQIDQLSILRQDAEKLATRCQEALSGMPDLPAEILSEIFLHFLGASDKWHCALTLCLVCHKWRDVAHAMPQLWTRLSLSLPLAGPIVVQPEGQSAIKHQFEKPMNAWLNRSGSLPLHMRLRCNSVSTVEDATVMLQLLSLNFNRWSTVEFAQYMRSHLALPEIPADGAPMLHTASFDLGSWSDHEIQWAMEIVRAAPQLRTLSWHGPIKVFKDGLPFSSLRSLILPDSSDWVHSFPIGLNACLSVLCHLPLLEELEVHFTFGRRDMHTVPSHTVHNHLRILKLHGVIILRDILESYTLPALTELLITTLDDTDWPHAEFLSFLSRSSPILSSLTIISPEIRANQIIECLEHPSIARTLQELNLNDPRDWRRIPNQVLEHLIPTESGTALPLLSTLHVGIRKRSQGVVLANLLQSRWVLPPASIRPHPLRRHAELKRLAVNACLLQRLRVDLGLYFPGPLKDVYRSLAGQGVEFE